MRDVDIFQTHPRETITALRRAWDTASSRDEFHAAALTLIAKAQRVARVAPSSDDAVQVFLCELAELKRLIRDDAHLTFLAWQVRDIVNLLPTLQSMEVA